MRKRIACIFLCMLLITMLFPTNATASDEENPEFEDRIFDVKLFGIFMFPMQFLFKYGDVVFAWISEDSSNTDYLYISMKVREFRETTELEAIYDINWNYKNDRYITYVHSYPNGYGPFVIGKSVDGDNEYEIWISCEGLFYLENNIITWQVPKNEVGSPNKGEFLTSFYPHTHLRFRDDSDLPHMDLFKDLYHNRKIEKDYQIQY